MTSLTIILRDLKLTDLAQYAHWQAPGHRWQEFDGPYYARLSPEALKARLKGMEQAITHNSHPFPRQRMVIADRVTDQLIGMVVWYWESAESNWASIGISIYDEKYWGKGIGYQALGLWTGYLFAAMPAIVRLDLRTWSGNLGMIHLAKKLGYQLEACFRDARMVKGQYYDGLAFGILRREWEQLHPKGFGVNSPISAIPPSPLDSQDAV